MAILLDLLPFFSDFLDEPALRALLLGAREAFAFWTKVPAISLATLPGIRRICAVRMVHFHWKRQQRRRWLEAVFHDVVQRSPFPHRLSVNLAQEHFKQGAQSIERLRRTRRFLPVAFVPKCPDCNLQLIACARFAIIGTRALSSTPCLYFGCDACCEAHDQEDRRHADFGQLAYRSRVALPLAWQSWD